MVADAPRPGGRYAAEAVRRDRLRGQSTMPVGKQQAQILRIFDGKEPKASDILRCLHQWTRLSFSVISANAPAKG